MRTIKFRAKAKGSPLIQDGTFVYGSLILRNENMPVIDIHGYVDGCGVHYEHTVDKDTIGQFTGLYDKNGKEIYEGDVVRCGEFIYEVGYGSRFASFVLLCKRDMFACYLGESMDDNECEVIGNIHDNPDLLKGGNQ